ncbi:MAG: DNA-binding response regulator [Bacteroidetes bacterium]|nr:MAG: DNA-binding response regulator [Bacteroidota bacterium]
MKIKVFIYDDSDVRRQSLRALVDLTPAYEYCGEGADCSNLLIDMERSRPDVVLMDINMPGVNGIDGLKMLKRNFPAIKVLMQTVFDDSNLVFESIRNGANGYVLKKDTPQRLTEAIKEVYDGGAVMNPGIAQKVLSFFSPKSHDHLLTIREVDVLKLLADGMSYKMAAAQLDISFHTVNAHVKKIYEKLHVQSLGEAIAYYYRHLG